MAGSLLTHHIPHPTSRFLLFTTFYLDEITCRMYSRAPERGQVLALQPHLGASRRCRV